MANKKVFSLVVVLILCGSIILLLLAFVQSYKRTESKVNVKVTSSANFSKEIKGVQFGNVIIPVSTAFTHTEQKKGLSGRESLPEEEGLLFIFSRPDFYGFWMKEMKFSIDIVWINENLVVTHIERDVKPNSFPAIYKPTEKSLYVLEVNSGVMARYGITVGDQANFVTN